MSIRKRSAFRFIIYLSLIFIYVCYNKIIRTSYVHPYSIIVNVFSLKKLTKISSTKTLKRPMFIAPDLCLAPSQ
jgi:hypothetical protein